jgi:hypothetical protein
MLTPDRVITTIIRSNMPLPPIDCNLLSATTPLNIPKTIYDTTFINDTPLSPPSSPLPSILTAINSTTTTYFIYPIEFDSNNNNFLLCRRCAHIIDFNKLASMPHLLPPGRQVFCLGCLLFMRSVPKDRSIYLFYQL